MDFKVQPLQSLLVLDWLSVSGGESGDWDELDEMRISHTRNGLVLAI